jgi:hypothetical protein
MVQSILISVGVVIFIAAVWYWGFMQYNQRRGVGVLRWLEGALASHGQISGVEWTNPSQFRARLRLSGSAFRQSSLEVHLAHRQMPLKWAVWGWHHRQETLTFEANLTCPPRRGLEIGRTRCTGLTRRWMQSTADWPTHTVATLFISNQPDWEPEITNRMASVVSTREFQFLEVSFRPRPPQFSATFSLQETLQHPRGELAIFDCLRELAESSPTSRM